MYVSRIQVIQRTPTHSRRTSSIIDSGANSVEQHNPTDTSDAAAASQLRGTAFRPLQFIAGWAIAGLLTYVPFVFGSVPPFAIRQIEFALTAATALWSLDCLLARRWPRVPAIVVICGF